MIPCVPEDTEAQSRGRAPSRPLMAAFMYERLQRMSTEHGLNLSPEDVLISAYLGHNLSYKPQAAGCRELTKEDGGAMSPMANRRP